MQLAVPSPRDSARSGSLTPHASPANIVIRPITPIEIANTQKAFFPDLQTRDVIVTSFPWWVMITLYLSLIVGPFILCTIMIALSSQVSEITWNTTFNFVWYICYAYIIWTPFINIYEYGMLDPQPAPLHCWGCPIRWQRLVYAVSIGSVIALSVFETSLRIAWNTTESLSLRKSIYALILFYLHPLLAQKWVSDHTQIIWIPEATGASPKRQAIRITPSQVHNKGAYPTEVEFKQVGDKLFIDLARTLRRNSLVIGIKKNNEVQVSSNRTNRSTIISAASYIFAVWTIINAWVDSWISIVGGFTCLTVLSLIIMMREEDEKLIFDVNYLQFFMAVIPFLPFLFTDFIWSQFSKYGDTLLASVLFLCCSQLYKTIGEAVIQRMSAPCLYTHFLFLIQLTTYCYQYALFGLSPWSWQLFVALFITNVNNLLSGTGQYWIWMNTCLKPETWPPCLQHLMREHIKKKTHILYWELIESAHQVRYFAQDTFADIFAFLCIPLFFHLFPRWGIGLKLSLSVSTDDPRFYDTQFLSIRIATMFGLRLAFWLIGVYIFHKRVKHLRSTFEGQALHQNDMLQRYLAEKLPSVYVNSFRQRYEDNYPELFSPHRTPVKWDHLWRGKQIWNHYAFYFTCCILVLFRLVVPLSVVS